MPLWWLCRRSQHTGLLVFVVIMASLLCATYAWQNSCQLLYEVSAVARGNGGDISLTRRGGQSWQAPSRLRRRGWSRNATDDRLPVSITNVDFHYTPPPPPLPLPPPPARQTFSTDNVSRSLERPAMDRIGCWMKYVTTVRECSLDSNPWPLALQPPNAKTHLTLICCKRRLKRQMPCFGHRIDKLQSIQLSWYDHQGDTPNF